MNCLCAFVMYRNLQRVKIFSHEIYPGCYIPPQEVFGTHNLTNGSTIVQSPAGDGGAAVLHHWMLPRP